MGCRKCYDAVAYTDDKTFARSPADVNTVAGFIRHRRDRWYTAAEPNRRPLRRRYLPDICRSPSFMIAKWRLISGDGHRRYLRESMYTPTYGRRTRKRKTAVRAEQRQGQEQRCRRYWGSYLLRASTPTNPDHPSAIVVHTTTSTTAYVTRVEFVGSPGSETLVRIFAYTRSRLLLHYKYVLRTGGAFRTDVDAKT